MKITQVVIACVAFCAPVVAFAGRADPAPAKPKPPTASPDKIICRAEDDTGSRITKKKVCMTAAQWRDSSFRAGQWVEHQSSNLGKPGGS